MSINGKWHKKNRMPKNPSLDNRIKWHSAHAKNCSCRPVPDKLLKIIKKGKI